MISVYLASVDFHLTRLLCSTVSSYGTNLLTGDKETETSPILLVTSLDLTKVSVSRPALGAGVVPSLGCSPRSAAII